VVSRQSLREKRPYIIVTAFVIGAALTPPDVISQTLLAVPMLLLFELGLYFSGWFLRQSQAAREEAAAASGDYKPMSDAEMDTELDHIEAGQKK
jgi:sec-independent protein translocase protein TatC